MLQILDIKKSFGELHVLRGVDLDVEQGDVVAIIGPSGSGKTTLLRCINFLEKADSGTHEMGFARTVSNKVIFMEDGIIVEQGSSKEFFENPKEERTKAFLRTIQGDKD